MVCRVEGGRCAASSGRTADSEVVSVKQKCPVKDENVQSELCLVKVDEVRMAVLRKMVVAAVRLSNATAISVDARRHLINVHRQVRSSQ